MTTATQTKVNLQYGIGAKFIQINLNTSDERLRGIYKEVRKAINNRTGRSFEKIDSEIAADVEDGIYTQTFNLIGKKFNRKSVLFTYAAIAMLESSFSQNHFQVSPETLEWGGFFSQDSFTTFDEKRFEKVLNNCF